MARKARDNYLTLRATTWWYVRDVPKFAREAAGRDRWKLSLRTSDRGAALKQARELANEHDAFLARCRPVAPNTALKLAEARVRLLPPEEREKIRLSGGSVEHYLGWLEARLRDSRHSAFEAASIAKWASDDASDGSPDIAEAAADADALRLRASIVAAQVREEARTLDMLGFGEVTLQAQRFPMVAEEIAAAKALTEAAKGTAEAADAEAALTVSGLYERWKAATGATSYAQFEYPCRLFDELHGNPRLTEITKVHVRQFRDDLFRLPSAVHLRPSIEKDRQAMTMPAMLEHSRNNPDTPRLAPATAAKHFRALKTILSFGVEEGFIEDSPAEGLRGAKPKLKAHVALQERRRPFSPAELRHLLTTAERVWATEPDHVWFLRMMVWTGARPEELAQLRGSDLLTDNVGGRYVQLTDTDGRRLKNQASHRPIPIHQALLELGFVAHFESRGSAESLFPFKADSAGRLYTRMGVNLRRLMTDHAGFTDPRLAPYSTRHSFKDAARRAGVPEEVAERLMGHRSPTRATARGYGEGFDIPTLRNWLNCIDPLAGEAA